MTHLLLIVGFLFFNPENAASQSFEGSITYMRITYTKLSEYKNRADTTFLTYYVKDDHVRIDEKSKSNELNKFTIVDLNEKSMRVFNPSLKLYCWKSIVNHRNTFQVDSLIESENTRMINGQLCYQWRIITQNEDIQFWVTQKEYKFYQSLIKLAAPNFDEFLYYLIFPRNNTYFPLLFEKRGRLREPKETIQVMDIKEKSIDMRLFDVPAGYDVIDSN